MAVDIEAPSFVMLPLGKIVSKLSVRRLSISGLKRIQESIKKVGFLENYPIVVVPLGDGTYLLVEGNHRYESAKAEGLTVVPCLIKYGLSEDEMYRLAIQSNSASTTSVPMTMVAYAEFVWARLDEKTEDGKKQYTQDSVAKMLGWSRGRVGDYALLQNISNDAWKIIVGAFDDSPQLSSDDTSTNIVGTPTFSETLLRNILDLTSEQQLELVNERVKDPKAFTPGKFASLAKAYQTRNEMKDYAIAQLGDLGEDHTTKLVNEVYSGAYDKDWTDNPEHPKLHKLIESIRDEWEKKNSIHLIHGDFYQEMPKVGTESIDLVLVDPPYNIARDNEFELEGRSNISQNFGEWDKFTDEQFIHMFSTWATEWARVLRPQGSGYIFTSDSYISDLRKALTNAGLHVKATIVWHKTNPGTQVVKTNFKSSVEYIVFFTKGEGGHTFNWQGENEMHNFIETPICGGNERLTDAKGNTLHPTQKPERVIRHFMEISSNRGDMILDGFMGVGTTGKVAKTLGRKFIGIEQDKAFYDAAVRRLTDEQ
jgi:site-specific DNA-methyltransferase (adenine-specific)/modification methylase